MKKNKSLMLRFNNLFKGLNFKTKREKKLENEIESLKTKLSEKQTQINRTNSYWKKKYYAATGKSH